MPRRALPALLAAVLSLAACTVGPGDGDSSTVAPPTSAPAEGTAPATSRAPTDAGPPACISGDAEFSDEGVIAAFGAGGGDAGIVSGLRWSIEDVCERFVVDLATDGGSPAATVGRTTVDLRRPEGILRIVLPSEVTASAISRTVVDGRMVAAAYVVALVDGSLAVDLHLDALNGVEARAFLATSPARIVVDLRSVAAAAPVTPPAASAETVLVAPLRGPAGYPLDVAGYVAPRVDEVAATLEGSEDVPLDLSVAGSDHLWREFTARVEGGPEGTVDLVVVSARDGEPVDELSVTLEVS